MDLVAAKNTKVIVTMEHVDKVLCSYDVSEITCNSQLERHANMHLRIPCIRMAMPKSSMTVTSLSLGSDVWTQLLPISYVCFHSTLRYPTKIV